MCNFEPKDLESLQQAKIKESFDEFPLSCNYLYIHEYKMLFITKGRTGYKICASAACHFEPVARTSTFDILYFNKDLDEVKVMYNSYLMRLIWDNKVEK